MLSPSLLKIMIWLVVAAIIIWLLTLALPAFVAAVPLALAVKKYHPSFSVRRTAQLARVFHLDALKAAGFFCVSAGLIGYGSVIAIGSLLDLARGVSIPGNSIIFLFSAGVIAAASWFFYQVLEGVYMKDIFTIIDDQERFDDFVSADESPVVIDINPVALAAAMRADVIGQDHIIEDVATTLARRVQLTRRKKPLAVLMFVGATGAGKTELAKSIAKHAFENRLLRFDMNEFTEGHSTQRLIGSPPGYMGSDQGGQLTREIKRMRSGVILFDEIEKAHPDVYKLIMGLLDEGRITEQSSGQTMDACKFAIVLTSNAEHEKLAHLVKTVSDLDERKRATKDTLQSVFKPEQLARIDEIFVFGNLDRRSLAKVIGKFLFGFADDAGVEIDSVDAELLIQTITKHEKSDCGIRELIRLVEKAVLDGMLEARAAGFSSVAIDAGSDGVVVRGARLREARA